MELVTLPRIGTVAAWRAEARRLAGLGVPPEAVLWHVGEGTADLFAAAPAATTAPIRLNLPRAAIDSIETALHHADPERFARAYTVVLRLAKGTLRWGDRLDPALARVLAQEQAVRRDIHKMHAFVRFREVTGPDAPRRAFAAWFEPEHPIIERAAPFFTRRFGDMDWVIATPTLTARFENGRLDYAETQDATPPPGDAAEDLWRAYFANIFNPARLMVKAMRSQMPRKYWHDLPEAALIPDLIRTAPARAAEMQARRPPDPPIRVARFAQMAARPPLPEVTLETMKPALDACRRCPVGACATQAVPGAGPVDARLMVVGEQPGDAEDLAGRPLIGPAGQLFDRCAAQAGLDRAAVYITNALKHFKFVPRGKRRLHRRPDAGEVQACRRWLDIERRTVRHALAVAMGATAALALTGRGGAIAARRGRIEDTPGGPVLLTYHPAYLLRLSDPAARAETQAAFVEDLARAAGHALHAQGSRG